MGRRTRLHSLTEQQASRRSGLYDMQKRVVMEIGVEVCIPLGRPSSCRGRAVEAASSWDKLAFDSPASTRQGRVIDRVEDFT